MDNMTKNINSQNKSVAHKRDQANQNLRNCQNPVNFFLDNRCTARKASKYRVFPGQYFPVFSSILSWN